jgi:hypothetical protein
MEKVVIKSPFFFGLDCNAAEPFPWNRQQPNRRGRRGKRITFTYAAVAKAKRLVQTMKHLPFREHLMQ